MAAISNIIEKMIVSSDGNQHDITHFMKVWGYAKVIGGLEQLDEHTQLLLEVAAVTHDIACPLCRETYGNTNGKLQEQEGAVLVADFLKDTGLTQQDINRVAFLVGHHHTYTSIDGPDYQILIEADYLVNAEENHDSAEKVQSAFETIFRTESGIRLLKAMYARHPAGSN